MTNYWRRLVVLGPDWQDYPPPNLEASHLHSQLLGVGYRGVRSVLGGSGSQDGRKLFSNHGDRKSSPKWGDSPSKWPKLLVNRGDPNHFQVLGWPSKGSAPGRFGGKKTAYRRWRRWLFGGEEILEFQSLSNFGGICWNPSIFFGLSNFLMRGWIVLISFNQKRKPGW